MTIDDQIQAKVDGFVAELSRLVREAALHAVAGVLGGAGPKAASPSKPARGPAKGAAPKVKAALHPKGAKRRPGEKRDAKQIAQLVDKLYQHILAHPGNGIETIGKAIGEPTNELALPVKKLLGDKKIKTTGQRRATKYFPASGTAKKSTAPRPFVRHPKKGSDEAASNA